MPDETPPGSLEIRHSQGGDERSSGSASPLQARAAFLENWDWESVVSHNRGVCERGRAQHGANSESQTSVAADWEKIRSVESSLGETLDFLRGCHRRAPFLFFNGNTFAEIGRTLTDFLFADLPTSRRRQATSAVAHYIAGVLPREAMVQIIEELSRAADLQPGMRVKTFAGSVHGVIVRVLEDGRIVVRPDGARSEMILLPENLLAE